MQLATFPSQPPNWMATDPWMGGRELVVGVGHRRTIAQR
jgi:hypothetical protein